jgi:DNA (cytosine-5)-methyltransferase 1
MRRKRIINIQDPTYPVIDLFAGPGGLGEGFSSVQGKNNNFRFRNVVSIERDEFSHRTLQLRHFYRSFSTDEVPDDYYRYLRGDIDAEELFRLCPAQFQEATRSALRISLGAESHEEVRIIIRQKLAGKRKWALVGGPPCQAYSLVGRSRMMGNPDFEQDERHFLYREYLKIIIDHKPPVFVMENVKGLLSAKVGGEPIIGRIVSDLSNPRSALENNNNGLHYRLYSLTDGQSPEGEIDPRQFLVKSENYGVPQARHRMFIVGIRKSQRVASKTIEARFPNISNEFNRLSCLCAIFRRPEK